MIRSILRWSCYLIVGLYIVGLLAAQAAANGVGFVIAAVVFFAAIFGAATL